LQNQVQLTPFKLQCQRKVAAFSKWRSLLTWIQTDEDFCFDIAYPGEENLVNGTEYGHGDTSSELNAISRSKRWTASTRGSNEKFL
jgi:hypothetical protein